MVQKDGWKNVLDFTKESLMKEIKFIKIKDYVGLANINFNKHELDLTSLLNEDWEIQESVAVYNASQAAIILVLDRIKCE
jgi:hypothetical protein